VFTVGIAVKNVYARVESRIFRVRMEKIERVPTGIPGLDPLIEGGFPKDSLIIIAGPAGSGKTIFSCQFLYQGAVKYGEAGLYVSFTESRDSFFRNFAQLQFNLAKLEEEKKFRFINLSSVEEEGVTEILSTVMEEVRLNKVSRLVIDSFTALAQAFKESIDVRILIRILLDRIVHQMGCTTLLIVETPIGEQKIGTGVEEFLADGIITLESFVDQLEMKRRALIRKMRGTNQSLKYHNIVISKDGIRLTPMV